MTTDNDTRALHRSRWVFGVIGAIEIAAGVLCLVGFPSWLILLLAPLPWILLARARFGTVVAVTAAIVLSMWFLFAIVILTAVIRTPMLGTVVIVLTIASLFAVALLIRRREVLPRPAPSTVVVWVTSALGSLVWLGVMLAANWIPGTARYSWVMLGDTANNLLFARGVVEANGMALTQPANPTPLPSVLLAVVFASGRGQVATNDLLRHDIAAFDQVWALLIVLACLTAGLLAGRLAKLGGAGLLVVGIVSAGASLLPLSWFYTGYPVEFGFVNATLALSIVFAAVVLYLAADRHPAIVLGLLCVTATLMFAVWDPLVLLIAALGVVVLFSHWRRIIATRGPALVVLVVCVAQLLAYGLGFVLPGLLQYSYFLSATGGVFLFHKTMIAVLGVGAVVVALLTFRRVRHPAVLGTIALVAGSAVGLAALLFESRDQPSLWTYYPVKFAWLASAVLVLVILGLVSAFLARYVRRPILQVGGLIALAAITVGFLEWTPSANPGYVAKDPAARVLEGDVFGTGDTLVDKVFRLATPGTANVLWHTNDPSEAAINFWIMQMWAGPSNKNLKLKYVAYGLDGNKKISVLCNTIHLMGGRANVYTAEKGLAAQLTAACPLEQAHVVLRSP